MSPPIAWGRFALFSTALVGGGYGLMRLATPSEEEFYNVIPSLSHLATVVTTDVSPMTKALAPDLKRKVDDIRAQRASSQEMRDKLAASAAEDKVVWADSQSTKPRRV